MKRYRLRSIQSDGDVHLVFLEEDGSPRSVFLTQKRRSEATGLAWLVLLVMRIFMPKALANTVQVFPTSGMSGGDIYATDGHEPSKALLFHEAIHCRQARSEVTVWAWRLKYLLWPDARVRYELEAYQAQVRLGVLGWDDVEALLVKYYMVSATRVRRVMAEEGLV